MESKIMLSKEKSTKNYLVFTIALLILPICYYSALNILTKINLQNTAEPLNISANRYLQAGAWPETKTSDELIVNFQSFEITEQSENKPK